MGGGEEDAVEEEIRSILGPVAVVGRRLVCLSETGSTNDDAKALAAQGGESGTVVIAESQTAGRGRQGRSFQSPKGKGLYLSALLRPELPPERLMTVTALAGVAVCRAVEEVCGLCPGIKWPNDPVLRGRKLCGILTELTGDGALVLGIGINDSQTAADFSPDVAEMATSLEAAAGRAVSRPALAAALIRALDGMYADLLAGTLEEYRTAYRRACVNLGRTVQLVTPRGRETAEAVDIDPEFGLVVRDAAGTLRTVRSGEVSVRGLYGYAE